MQRFTTTPPKRRKNPWDPNLWAKPVDEEVGGARTPPPRAPASPCSGTSGSDEDSDEEDDESDSGSSPSLDD